MAADQCLCFHYTDSKISLYPKSELASLLPSPVALQFSLCPTWLETRTRFDVYETLCPQQMLVHNDGQIKDWGGNAETPHLQNCSVIISKENCRYFNMITNFQSPNLQREIMKNK